MNGDKEITSDIECQEEEIKKGSPKEGQAKAPSPGFDLFFAQFEQMTTPEEKVRLTLDFMRFSLSQSGTPRFEDFWAARRLLLPLFKENMNPKGRSQYWLEYLELSSEGRRLKEILDEQSAFAVEQIELAIAALEQDLANYNELLDQIPDISFPVSSKTFMTKKEMYNTLQRELYLLNTLASRINGLRKEVIKTGMKVRQKNNLFEKLSVCGDRIFPRRKELIKLISDAFTADVGVFITTYFQDVEKESQVPPYLLREEIKILQGIAKSLTLNTHSFTETRLQLSRCWDDIKLLEKERKKELTQKKQIFKENCELVVPKIAALVEITADGTMSLDELNRQAQEILEFMKSLELGREEVRYLKEELHKARQPVMDKLKEAEEERNKKEKEAVQQRVDRIESLRAQLKQVIENAAQYSYDKLIESRDQMLLEFDQLSLSKLEKQTFDRLFKQLKEAICDQKEKAVMSLSPDAREALDQLEAILNQRKEQKQEIKEQLESYRKALGGSGLDFEKGMLYRELIEEEKIRLEKANEAIKEIEEKIAEIEE